MRVVTDTVRLVAPAVMVTTVEPLPPHALWVVCPAHLARPFGALPDAHAEPVVSLASFYLRHVSCGKLEES